MADGELEIFRADRDDAPGIAAVHAAAFAAAYDDVLTDEARARVPSVQERVTRWQGLLDPGREEAWTLVAERDGTAVGFCSVAAPARDAALGERTAELAALYVHPGRWRAGVGGALVDRAVADLTADGWAQVTLWVLVENVPARAFYERHGFAADGDGGPDPVTGRPKMRLRRRLLD